MYNRYTEWIRNCIHFVLINILCVFRKFIRSNIGNVCIYNVSYRQSICMHTMNEYKRADELGACFRLEKKEEEREEKKHQIERGNLIHLKFEEREKVHLVLDIGYYVYPCWNKVKWNKREMNHQQHVNLHCRLNAIRSVQMFDCADTQYVILELVLLFYRCCFRLPWFLHRFLFFRCLFSGKIVCFKYSACRFMPRFRCSSKFHALSPLEWNKFKLFIIKIQVHDSNIQTENRRFYFVKCSLNYLFGSPELVSLLSIWIVILTQGMQSDSLKSVDCGLFLLSSTYISWMFFFLLPA